MSLASTATRWATFDIDAATITLIDRNKLIEKGLGVKRKQITLLEFTLETLEA